MSKPLLGAFWKDCFLGAVASLLVFSSQGLWALDASSANPVQSRAEAQDGTQGQTPNQTQDQTPNQTQDQTPGSEPDPTLPAESSSGNIIFDQSSYTVNEDAGSISLTLNRVNGNQGELTAKVQTSDGSAKADEDYNKKTAEIIFGANDTSKQVSITINKNEETEKTESFNVTLSDSNGGKSSTEVMIEDVAEPVAVAASAEFSSASYSADEGTEALITVSRTGDTTAALEASVEVSAGSGAEAGADFDVPTEQLRLSWAADEQASRTIKIPIKADSEVEEGETIILKLFSADNTQIGSATLTIIDTTPAAESSAAHFASPSFEGTEGSSVAVSIVRESDADALTLDLLVGAEGDSASAGEDYQSPATTQLTWAAGESGTKIVDIALLTDDLEEGVESVSLQLKQGEQTLDSAQLNINDTAVEASPASPTIGVTPISGDRQTAQAGAKLSPFVIKVEGVDANAVSINWSVDPPDGGNLTGGSSTSLNAEGESRNTFTLNTNERVIVTATITQNPTSKRQARAQDSNSVRFIINPEIADAKGLDTNEEAVATSLDDTCSELENKPDRTVEENDLLATCQEVEEEAINGDEDVVEEDLEALSADEVASQGTAAIEAATLQVNNVNTRLSTLRSGSRGLDVSGLHLNIEGQALPGAIINSLIKGELTGGAAGDIEDLSGNWGVFINGNISFGDKDKTDKEAGFEFDAQGITAGIDYRISAQAIIGFAAGISTNESEFTDGSSGMELEGVHVMLYGTYYQSEHFYLDGLIKAANNDFTTRRKVSRRNDLLQEALSETTGQEYSGSLSAGFEYNAGGLSYGPYGRISYTRVLIDAYTETASNPGRKGSGSMLSLGDQSLDSATAAAGGQLSYAISGSRGVLSPQLRVEWGHEFSDKSREISAQFVHDPSSSRFVVATDQPDEDFVNLGLGLSAVTAGGRSGFLEYETRLAQQDISQHWIRAGVRFEFR